MRRLVDAVPGVVDVGVTGLPGWVEISFEVVLSELVVVVVVVVAVVVVVVVVVFSSRLHTAVDNDCTIVSKRANVYSSMYGR